MKGLLTKVVTLGIINQIYLNAEEFNSQNVAIISGQRAQIGQFPWHVLLWLGEIDYERGICGGSIISNNWVLTSAGCVYESYSVDLVFGTIELNKNNITMTSTVIIIHPEFNREVLTNNIALIELPTALEFSDIIQPIQLMSLAEISRNFTGVEVIITGFGRSEQKNPNFSHWLLWTSLEIIDITTCSKSYDTPVSETELCAHGLGGFDSSACDGDAGSALVWKNNFERLIQIGIFSYTKLNQCFLFPNVFTKVTPYLGFIRNITGLHFE